MQNRRTVARARLTWTTRTLCCSPKGSEILFIVAHIGRLGYAPINLYHQSCWRFPNLFRRRGAGASGVSAGVMMADLATATVAAMAPTDFHSICDELVAGEFRPSRRLHRDHRQGQPARPHDRHRRRIPPPRQARHHRRPLCEPFPGAAARPLRRAGERRDRGNRRRDSSPIFAPASRRTAMSATSRRSPLRRCRAGIFIATTARFSARCRPRAAVRSNANSATSSNIWGASSATSRSPTSSPNSMRSGRRAIARPSSPTTISPPTARTARSCSRRSRIGAAIVRWSSSRRSPSTRRATRNCSTCASRRA